MKRAVSLLLVALSGAYIAFLLTGFVAARLVGRDEFGLAPAATVVAIAIAGGVIGFIASGILASRSDDQKISTAAFRMPVLALILHFGVAALAVRVTPTPVPTSPATPTSLEKPPLPATGVVDSLQGLASISGDSLVRYETKEIDYEVPAVTVYRQLSNWYLIGLASGGRDWIDARQVAAYHPLDKLLPDRLNYLTDSWDRRLRESADPSSPSRAIAISGENSREVPVRVVETSGSGAALAIKVEVFDRSPCDGGDEPKVIATGWVPAWNSAGKVNVWFYSRGC